MSKIEIRDFSQEYIANDRRFLALDHINLNIEEGEFVCIIGHSGCGKSTLLSAIDGLLPPPLTGGIYIDGELVNGPGKSRALIFQNYSLFPWMTAVENISFALEQADSDFKSKNKNERREIAKSFLERVDLTHIADKYPGELSGGMQQRVAIARALAVDSEILLADEPFGAIDPKNRANLQQLLINLWANDEKKKTVVFVTHDIDEAILLADRIIFMDPKVITEDIKIDLPRPRIQSGLILMERYHELRNKLIALFYRNDITEG